MKKALSFLIITIIFLSCTQVPPPAPANLIVAAMTGTPWVMTAYAVDSNNNGIIDANELKQTNDTIAYSLFLHSDSTGSEVYNASFYKYIGSVSSGYDTISLNYDTTVTIKKWNIKIASGDTNFYATNSANVTVMSKLINLTYNLDSVVAHSMTIQDTTHPIRWAIFHKL